jgi:selenocysteine-specific elongation factor
MPLTVGTAGHVDHGKTWLVRALTGKDTDRLPEERARGMSIDLGYAPLDLPGGLRASLVDVPGHERFIRNMVAGATGIDLFLLVVDAREGPRPQTHEHLRILRLLGISTGVVAVTKADAVDGERLAAALEEAFELGSSQPVAVSAKNGAGLEELRSALAHEAGGVEPRASADPTRLFVDRAFTLRGIGTVATGTLWSGSIRAGDELAAEPGGIRVRVRSVQVHDEDVAVAEAGQRVAVALPRVPPRQLPRGTALVEPGAYSVAYRLDVALEELEAVPPRVTAHHGTVETPARVRRRDGAAQLRLASPLVASPGDRVLLRTHTTVGAGIVLERQEPVRPAPPPVSRTAPPPAACDDARVHLPGGFVLDRAELEKSRSIIVAECEREGTITLARARDLLGTSRKLAQAILERLDGDGVMLRIGDERRLRRRSNYDRRGAAGPGGPSGLQNR